MWALRFGVESFVALGLDKERRVNPRRIDKTDTLIEVPLEACIALGITPLTAS